MFSSRLLPAARVAARAATVMSMCAPLFVRGPAAPAWAAPCLVASSSRDLSSHLRSIDTAKAAIASTKVIIFSKSFCPYCTKAKKVLESWHVDAVIVELDLLSNGGDLQAELLGLSGQRTVPNIYISGHHVGGCDALLAAEKSGKLKTLLDGAGVHYKQPLA